MTVAARLTDAGIKLGDYRQGQHYATCPQCSATRADKTAKCLSVKIDSDGAVFSCHHCGWVGDANPRRAEPAAQERAAGVKRPKPDFSRVTVGILSEKVLAFFATRGITRPTLERMGITHGRGWIPALNAESDAILFPYRKPGGEVANYKLRGPGKQFSQVKGGEKLLFGIDQADPGNSPDLIVCEGEIDQLSLVEAGIDNAVSVPDGAPRQVKDGPIDPEHDAKFEYVWNCKDEIERFTRVILATDADEPGMALREELARRIGREKCWLVSWPEGCKDANDVLVKLGADELRACIDRAQPHPIKSLFSAGRYEDAVVRLFRDGRSRGHATGWPGVDALYTVRPGELTIVTGIPNSGKSEWVDALLVNLAQKHDWKFSICSFENPPDEHIAKWSEKLVQAPFWDGPRHRMSEASLREAVRWLDDRFFLIRAEDDAPTIDWILATAKSAVMRHGIKGLVIDPYNEIEHHRPAAMREDEYVSQLLGKVKRFCQGHGVHAWFIAHPTKMQRDKDGKIPVPNLYDISGGAQWSNKADNGIVIHRDWAPNSRKVEVHVKKIRFKAVGKVGIAELQYEPSTGIYSAPTPTQRAPYAD